MNAELLKKALLQWAIEGKLVPQSDDEEGVGNIGGIPENIPFAIPKKWKWAKLGQVFALKAGKFISSSEIKASGEYPCYGGNGVRGFLDRYNREGRFPLIGRQGALCGNINLADGKFYATEHAVVADGGDRIDPDCAAFFLTALNLNQYATHTAQPGLSVKRISETPFPVPPFKEQLRISQKLNEILPLVEAYGKEQEALLKLERELPGKLRASILQEAIQGKLVPQLDEEPAVKQIGVPPEDVPFAIPEKWKWARLGEVVGYGSASQVSPKDISGDTWVLDLEDIEKETGRLLQKKKNIRVSSNKSVFKKGDVLYGKLRPYLNKVLIANEDGVCTTEIVPISMESAKCPLDREYFQLYLMSPIFVNYANQCSYGVKMPRLGTKDAKAALIPIPPLKEQQRIVRKLKSIFDEFYILK